MGYNYSLIFSLFFFFFLHLLVHAANAKFSSIPTIPFNKGFTHLFGDSNLILPSGSHHNSSVNLHLNQYSGSGFRSSELYNHGFFSASIKLPSAYTAGIVVAFYTTNGDVFEKTHDELDFEFLGNIKGKPWRFQTNLYGNGSTSRGREERYTLWFDPSKEYHRYSILWTTHKIIFYIDETPIRLIERKDEMGSDYPAKPMGLYATIWDASNWATSGGKYKVNYKYAPFVAQFTDLVLHGCAADPIREVSANTCAEKDTQLEKTDYANVTPRQRMAMMRFREKYMYYSYCYDKLRYPTPLPECVIDPTLRQKFKDTGRLKFEGKHRRYSKGRNYQAPNSGSTGDEEEDS